MKNIANKISIFRILLIPLFITAIIYYTPQRHFLRPLAVGIFCLAMLSDVLDGYIARLKGECTKLGAFLDPLADKLLISSSFICLALVKALPFEFKFLPWIVIIVISRDIILGLGSAIIYRVKGRLKITPTILGKITTCLQMVTVLTLLLKLRIFPYIMYAMVVFTVLSGLNYIRIGFRQFMTK